MIIGLTGTFAAGKGTVAEYLIGKGIQYYSLSDELRLLLREKGISSTRDNLMKAGNTLRAKYGKGFLANLIVRRLRGSPSVQNSVVDGIRNLGEIEAMREFKDFSLVAVDAPVDIRYERAKQRGTERDPKSFSVFMVEQKREMAGKDTEQQIALCMKEADFKITNDGDYKKLYKQIDKILEDIKGKAAAAAISDAKK